MSEKFIPSQEQHKNESEERTSRLRLTKRGGAALGVALLGAGITLGVAAERAFSPEEVASFTVESDINPAGDIAELEDAIIDQGLNPDDISGVYETGQTLDDGSNTIVIKENSFNTWVERVDTPEDVE